jgi:histone demethylase JARID1
MSGKLRIAPFDLISADTYRYHNKCLKIARGKIKEDEKYTCPVCDYRLKIPRDATRPKLEDLQTWQDEISVLPFQPEEEETLDSIINDGTKFRDYVARYINPVMSCPDELTTYRFYLRKLEGAEILLSNEINFFRQELHRWAPVAPSPPPILNVSLSTRKARPTKQQKLMVQHGVSNPDDLPSHLRTKNNQYNKQRQSLDLTRPQSLQPAPEPSHTPPGEPPRMHRNGFGGDQDYFNNSPTFASNGPLNFGASAMQQQHIQPIDPGLFEGQGQDLTSPLQDVFKSSTGHAMFGEVLEPGGGQAEEALAVTEASGYMD